VALIAINELEAWAQIAYRVETSRNLDPDARSTGNALLPPRSETLLMALATMDSEKPAEGSFSYQYIIGHPGARHRPDLPYRLPYALAQAHRVSQAYPDSMTHAAPANRYAVDFEMPIGTRICAARGGVVIEVVGDFVDAGLDPERDGERANFVRVLHDDGTLALYGHLDPGSIRVAPGQRIGRGEHIADSGNTGYSSGPHLHFVVQRNRAGALESVPVSFAGAGGVAFTPETGDVPVAY
jgi:murein DD-endopeptidase MepM/ murein hydrolase activator NlpD